MISLPHPTLFELFAGLTTINPHLTEAKTPMLRCSNVHVLKEQGFSMMTEHISADYHLLLTRYMQSSSTAVYTKVYIVAYSEENNIGKKRKSAVLNQIFRLPLQILPQKKYFCSRI